jgi:hypothetical protein
VPSGASVICITATDEHNHRSQTECAVVTFYTKTTVTEVGSMTLLPCDAVFGRCHRFGETYCFYLQGFFGTLVSTYECTHHHNPEEHRQPHCRENCK